jgi:kynurenine formamidase
MIEAASAKKRIFDLAVPLEQGMPSSGHHPAFNMALVRRHGDKVRPGGGGGTSANELITTGCHVGTHVDAIGHWAMDGKIHGGLDAAEATKGGRFRYLGADEIQPMVCRGVLLDIPAVLGVDRLSPGYGITPEDLEKALGSQSLNAGDVALIRTGWKQLYHDSAAFLGGPDGVPGVTGPAAEWLAQHGVVAAGTDTTAFDQIVPGPDFLARPAHTILLFKNAIHIIELLDLEELAAEGVKAFLFVLAPLKLVGATGSPVRPLAVIDA